MKLLSSPPAQSFTCPIYSTHPLLPQLQRLIDYYGIKLTSAAALMIEDPKAAAKYLKADAKPSDVPEFVREFQEVGRHTHKCQSVAEVCCLFKVTSPSSCASSRSYAAMGGAGMSRVGALLEKREHTKAAVPVDPATALDASGRHTSRTPLFPHTHKTPPTSHPVLPAPPRIAGRAGAVAEERGGAQGQQRPRACGDRQDL